MKTYRCTHEGGDTRDVEHIDAEAAAAEFVEWLCGQDSDYYGMAERDGVDVTVDGKPYHVTGEPSMNFYATQQEPTP